MKTNYKVVDLETTSLRTSEKIENGQVVAYPAEIIEIGVTDIDNLKVGKNYSRFVKPDNKIPKLITDLTGITNDMVKDAKKLKDVLANFRKFIGDDTVIAHNARYDITLINYYLEKFGLPKITKYICTLELLKKTPSYQGANNKLGTACEYYGIKNIKAHRAYADTYATAQLFLILTKQTTLI